VGYLVLLDCHWSEELNSPVTMRGGRRSAYLRCFIHLSIRLAVVLEDWIPALEVVGFQSASLNNAKNKSNRIRKRGNIPKSGGPLGGTILPGVRPWNRIGSSPGPAENANVQTADADLSSYAERRLFSPV
jgi:hypothetical protein